MNNLYKKLFEIQKLNLVFERTAINPFHKSKYCPLPQVWAKLEKELNDRELLCIHQNTGNSLKTTIIDMTNSESISSECIINSVDAQKIGSDITYFKRYNLGCIFNIITDDDTDGNKKEKSNKKVFDKKRLNKLIEWAKTVKKEEVMQNIFKIKKEYEIEETIKNELDLFIKTLK